jgi:hypothetical protein
MALRNDQIPGDAVAVTPSDSTAVDFYGLYVGTGGDVAVKANGGTAVTFKNVPSGSIIALRVLTVMSTNTTATDIVGFKV